MSQSAAASKIMQALTSQVRTVGAEVVGCRAAGFARGRQLAIPGFNADLKAYAFDCATVSSVDAHGVLRQRHLASNLSGRLS
jgi:hypothetical protein